jgi:uncharacterized protein Yka (UPF0111/DUF47 family)
LAKRTESAGFFVELLTVSDDALDFLEEATFTATLSVPDSRSGGVYAGLVDQAEVALKASQEYLKALYAADYLQSGYAREELEDFLAPVDQVLSLEEEGDEVHRRAEKVILDESDDFKQLWVLLSLSHAVEGSLNCFMRAVYVLRDYVLENASR